MEYTDVLRCLSIEDPQLAEHLAKRDEIGSDVLDPKTVALARLAALVAIGGALPTYSTLTDAAIGMGATPRRDRRGARRDCADGRPPSCGLGRAQRRHGPRLRPR